MIGCPFDEILAGVGILWLVRRFVKYVKSKKKLKEVSGKN